MAISERAPLSQPEQPLSLAELSRRYLRGEIGIDDYLAQERQFIPRFGEPQTAPDTAAIASHVAGVVDNLQRDSQAIQNPFEICRRADMAMVATLQLIESVLPDSVREQVNQLISIHDAAYQAAVPSTEHQEQGIYPMTNYHLTPPTTLPSLAAKEAREKRRQVLKAVRERRKRIYQHFREQMREQHKHNGYDFASSPQNEQCRAIPGTRHTTLN